MEEINCEKLYKEWKTLKEKGMKAQDYKGKFKPCNSNLNDLERKKIVERKLLENCGNILSPGEKFEINEHKQNEV